jgi:hypothetical protein
MPYVEANTANHLGWRTLEGDSQFGGGRLLARVTTLGDGPPPYSTEYLNSLIAANLVDQAGVDAVMRGEISLDDAMAAYQPVGTVVPELPTQAAWYDLLGQLQQSNEELKLLEAGIHDYPSLGPEIAAARDTYTGYVTVFQRIYTLAFSQPAAGLEGLGIDPATAAIVAASFTILLGLVVAFHEYVVNVLAPRAEAAKSEAQASQAAQQNMNLLLAAADEQDAKANELEKAGDRTGAAQYRQWAKENRDRAGSPAGPPKPPQDLAQWVMDNAKWIAVGALAFVALPPLIKKL